MLKAIRSHFLVIIQYVLFCWVLSSPGVRLYAQEVTISQVTGSVSGGASVVLAGQSFGDKPSGSPFKWDDFQGGQPGSIVSTAGVNPWSVYSAVPGVSVTPQYAPAYAALPLSGGSGLLARFAGDISARQYFAQQAEGYVSNVSLYLNNAPSTLYMSGWANYAMSPDSTMRNLKIFQHNRGEWTSPTTRWDLYPVTSSGHVTSERCSPSEYVLNQWGAQLPARYGWHRIEAWHDRNASGELLKVWIDGAQVYNAQASFSAGCSQTSWYIMSYADRQTSLGTEFLDWHWSELYIDNTLARVEIGNAATFSGSSHREIQIPISWTSNSITFTVNLGTFTPGQTVWLYVVNSAGAVNANGYPVVVAGGDSNSPGAPTQLRVTD